MQQVFDPSKSIPSDIQIPPLNLMNSWAAHSLANPVHHEGRPIHFWCHWCIVFSYLWLKLILFIPIFQPYLLSYSHKQLLNFSLDHIISQEPQQHFRTIPVAVII